MKRKQDLTCKCTNFVNWSNFNQLCNDFVSFVISLSSCHNVFYKIWNKFDEKCMKDVSIKVAHEVFDKMSKKDLITMMH